MTNFYIMHNEILNAQSLCNRAKVLFAMLYSRRKLSLANGFANANGEPYVFCSAESASDMLFCSRKTAAAALRELETLGYIENSGAKNRFFIKKLSGNFVMIPVLAADLGCDCAVLYAHIAAKIQSGLKTYCNFKISQIQAVLCCGNKKACELLSKLKTSRHIEIRRTCKGNILSLCGDMAKTTLRIIAQKIEKIKTKNAAKADSFSARRNVDIADAKCDFCHDQSVIFTTKIYNNKINNINYISQSDCDEQKREMCYKKLSLENFEERHGNIVNALKTAVGTKRKSIRVGERLCKFAEIAEKIGALSVLQIADICENILKQDNIRNLQSYALACVMNYSAQNNIKERKHSYNLDDFDKLAVGIAPRYW